ncbi:hypothetical protein EDD15DRAFT_1358814 [Pisolithus albus]|nr:hypothetical protein EDD15DRAFT_1358814 [Pisolithus albus]
MSSFFEAVSMMHIKPLSPPSSPSRHAIPTIDHLRTHTETVQIKDVSLHGSRTCGMFSPLCPASQTVESEIYVGAGPSGITAALTLARNFREKTPTSTGGQHSAGIQPRTFEVFHFLRAPEIHERATPVLLIQRHKRGSLEPLETFSMIDYMVPPLAIPY